MAILVGMVSATLLLPLCAISVDVARWYVEVQRVQNAADAAAMAGVTWLPDNISDATSTAKAVAADNGFPESTKVKVTVAVGEKPTQLRVTISSAIPNAFGKSFGVDMSTITRSAMADYNGPAPMGSPCNAFGNEPGASQVGETDLRGPSNSVIVAPPGGATCPANPQFWGAIAGPDTPKGEGDAFMTRTCASGNSGCTGTKNNDFDPLGYFYVVRVGEAAKNTAVTVQLFDPAFVEVGDRCDGPKTSGKATFIDGMNPYAPDGATRYKAGADTAFCTGDVYKSGSPIVTSFAMRAPTDTYSPVQGEPLLDTSGAQCSRQYPGYQASSVNSETLTSSNTKYKQDVAQVFRQWIDLCTFRPQAAGDYYLQVRTNVALGGTTDNQGANWRNPAVYTQTTDNTAVKSAGNNRFAIRVKGTGRSAVAISGQAHMSLYANYPKAESKFNLVRVIPAAATKTLDIGFFDVGDADEAGTLTVLPPTDSNLPPKLVGCTGYGVKNGALTDCKLTNVSSGSYGGKWQRVTVPIPAGYSCTSEQSGGCWFRLSVNFPGGLSDTTTWATSVNGEPVRLIE